ncbi:Ddb1- and cul4-associated factor 5 [Plakobranchus ocellatus]|uniref:Ddb1- and cul4-associated factor 5 n=1 Tax=Plakobranchus ocellatus TaxID=259542 RepID=A0AAV4DVY7_9GAST|nr:Ddb1- and cul4-associated factor 5 [Plakobranchus ocellatus]
MEDLRSARFAPTVRGLRSRETNGTALHSLKAELIGHRLAYSQSLMKKDLRGHFGCVNAIEFSSDGKFIASGGDDRRLLLWDVGRAMVDDRSPDIIDTQHISNINSCCFDCQDEKIATGGNDGQVIIHDFHMHQSTAVYGLSDAVYCLSADPQNSTILATANDEGKAQIIDTRLSADTVPFVLADLDSAMHSVMYNPVDPRLLVTANSKHGVALWDIRMPLKALHYKSVIQNCMSVCFNSLGDKIFVLRRRAGPVLYDVGKPNPIYEFDYLTYYNACTLKSCSFAGLHDEYVMSGSDDFCIYLWKIPTDPAANYIQCQPHMILKGHRSIVNQVRYCPQNQVIISCGVEKLIKMWSPYSIPGCSGHLVHNRRYGDDDETERDAYSHEEYIHMVLQAGSFLSHDYSNGSIEEEPCMIAFFDSLIQREIEQTVQEYEDDEDSITLGNKSDEQNDSDSHSSGGNSDDDNDDNDSSGNNEDDDGGGGGIAGVRNLKQSTSDAPLCLCSSSQSLTSSTNAVPGTAADSDTEDANTQGAAEDGSRPSEESSHPFYLELESSSSGSDTEVDDILSAMYSRYMSARERAASSVNRPASKKISSVIACGKRKESRAVIARKAGKASETAKKKKNCPCRLQRIREDLQHSGDQFLRDNATNMSMLADVIDSFIDDLVPDGSGNSRSDANDGNVSSDFFSRNNSGIREDLTVSSTTASSSFTNSEQRLSVSSRTNSGSFSSLSRLQGSNFPATASTSYGNASSPQIFSESRRSAAAASSSSPNLSSGKNSHPDTRINQQLNLDSINKSSSVSVADHGASVASDHSKNAQVNGQNGADSFSSHETLRQQIVKRNDPTNTRTCAINNNVGKNPAHSSVSKQPFSLIKPRYPSSGSSFQPEVSTNNRTFPLTSNNGSGELTDSVINVKGEKGAKFIAPEKKTCINLPKKPSLLSASPQTISSSSSSSSLSSDFNGMSDNSTYFASSSSLEPDSAASKGNQVDSNGVKVSSQQTDTGVGRNIVPFKKAKVRGRHFRSRRVDSDSSSEEER